MEQAQLSQPSKENSQVTHQPSKEDIQIWQKMQRSPIYAVQMLWGLLPQPLKPEYRKIAETAKLQDFQPEWFEQFVLGKHITWQQWLLLRAVEFAINGKGPKRITVESGHGTGKSTTLSWLLIWYLLVFKDAQVPCTAPTSAQMHDVLWKEVAAWIQRLPKELKPKFQWSAGYVRIDESPQTWFARARTASKDKPEALAGIHGLFVMFLIDEAAGVPEEVFNTAEGSLTGPNVLVIMISQHTRLIGYFHDSHTRDKLNWQCLSFNSEYSPIVDRSYVARIVDKHGLDSDEYRIRVQGKQPKEDAIDDKGYVPLLSEKIVKFCKDSAFVGPRKMGIDPAGQGKDVTSWVVRDNFKSKIVCREKISNAKSIALKTLTLMIEYDIKAEEIFIDNFGEGANVAQELGLCGERVFAYNTGDDADDTERYLNKKAETAWRARQWLTTGGELVEDNGWQEVFNIRYRRELNGKLKIMSKKEMRDEGIPSPNHFDAFALTFTHRDKPPEKKEKPKSVLNPMTGERTIINPQSNNRPRVVSTNSNMRRRSGL